MRDDALVDRPAGLYCPAGAFHIDPSAPVERAVITQAARASPGSGAYLCATPALPLLRQRLGADVNIESLGYGELHAVGGARLSLHPAGHALGSAQVCIEAGGPVWVLAGAYQREGDPTCAPFEPVRCDVFVTEATYALPLFRWDEPARVARAIFDWWQADSGRASVLFCRTSGKAQRLLGELAQLTDREVWVHGDFEPWVALYRAAGARLLPTRTLADAPRGATFAGELVLAPPSARTAAWLKAKAFRDRETGFASGLMRLRGTRRRGGFDRGFALSGHADWPGLLRTIRETGAHRILALDGHRDALVRHLREQGKDAATLGVAPLPAPAPEVG